MIPQIRYGHRTDEKRPDGNIAPDRTVPRTIPFGQRIWDLAADGQELHAPVFSENQVVSDVTRAVIADERHMLRTRDTRITGYEPLLSPAALLDELPLDEVATATVERSRAEVRGVLEGSDDRLLVIAGPCSVHDPGAALEYAGRLRAARERHEADLLVVMRVYFEKPRTVTGWKGLINDPGMDGGHDVHRGLRTARRLLLDVVSLGLPVGCEWLDPITPQYIADAVSWGAIGARTTESQVHRQLASGLSMPVGFKNGTDGDVQVAVDACRASAAGHTFFGVTPNGVAAVVRTAGNPDTHVILRGGRSGPNFEASHVGKALDLIGAAGLPRRLMVDASHGNSGKDHRRQPVVAAAIAGQVAAGERGLAGVMLESFLAAGRQEPGPPATLAYGQSVTDACLDFETTAAVLDHLAAAVRSRREFLCRTGRARAPLTHHGQPGQRLVDPLLRHPEQPLPFAIVEHLASELQSATYEPGDVIIREGQHGERFYIIAAGQARAAKDGKQLSELGIGDPFGGIALLRYTELFEQSGIVNSALAQMSPASISALPATR